MIRTAAYQSKFCDEPHLNLWIGNEPLQEWLHRHAPGFDLENLVPAWLGWLESEDEQQLVWDRVWPFVGKTQIVPLLVCPDDLDLSCTLLLAEVSSTEDEVVWERLGLDSSPSRGSGEIGAQVAWFDIPAQRFQREEYLECVRSFLVG